MKLSKKKVTSDVVKDQVVSLEKYKSLKLLEEYKKKYRNNPDQLLEIEKIVKLVEENRAIFKIVDGKPRIFTPDKIKLKSSKTLN